MSENTIKEVLFKLERIEHHMELLKKQRVDDSEAITLIRSSLIGNDLNGNYGLIPLFKIMEQRIERLEDKDLISENNIQSFKTATKWLFGILAGYFVWLLTSK